MKDRPPHSTGRWLGWGEVFTQSPSPRLVSRVLRPLRVSPSGHRGLLSVDPRCLVQLFCREADELYLSWSTAACYSRSYARWATGFYNITLAFAGGGGIVKHWQHASARPTFAGRFSVLPMRHGWAGTLCVGSTVACASRVPPRHRGRAMLPRRRGAPFENTKTWS